MVGIAGKSKACYDCKRRRVKCDVTYPTCLRCSKMGIVCRGYQQSTVWVHRTQTRPNVSALSVVKSAKLEEQRKKVLEEEDSLSSLLRMRIQVEARESTYNIATFRLQALSVTERIYFPKARVRRNNQDSASTPSSWLNAVCQMQRPSDPLDHSLIAFCAVQIRLSGADISHNETVQLYNQALSKIIAVLDSPSEGNSDEILAAIVILSTCELFLFHASTSWNAHAQGISEILRHRAVSDTDTQNWSDLCRRLCVICVIQAMLQKRPLILEPHIWRQHITPTAVVSFGGLLDLAIDVPSIMAEAYDLSHTEYSFEQSLPYINLLMKKFYNIDSWRALQNKTTWEQSQTPVYWSVPAKASNPTDSYYTDKLFPFALIFESIESASSWIFGSTMMLDILDTVLLLRPNATLPRLNGSLDDSIILSVPDTVQSDADKIARLLCQAIEYCYRTENGTFGPQITCYAQATLRTYFAHRGLHRELDWCRAISDMTGPGASFGIGLMQFSPLSVL
ncbi:hypothetical protein BKA59DRAFT_471370 [Fusarium tricinctum]|uniref:Zn(2)-C6 fungal-type domain-containing protein n=1 Tax=Fusarium tricinctum TaxID=61284 RepID=A0A8K0WCE3_9HYPO|nr:hypothetical protein BKA59DRAFT_471370 [Fusarium tricinctum]